MIASIGDILARWSEFAVSLVCQVRLVLMHFEAESKISGDQNLGILREAVSDPRMNLHNVFCNTLNFDHFHMQSSCHIAHNISPWFILIIDQMSDSDYLEAIRSMDLAHLRSLMCAESDRLRTFTNWVAPDEYMFINRTDLAREGFYYGGGSILHITNYISSI